MRLIVAVVGKLAQLSPRERQVGRLLAHGASNKAIGHSLGMAVSTVKGHLAHMCAKLGLANRVQLCAWLLMHPESVEGLAVPAALVLPFHPHLGHSFPLQGPSSAPLAN